MAKRYWIESGKLLNYSHQPWSEILEAKTHDSMHVSDFAQLMLFGLDVYDDGSWPGDVLWGHVRRMQWQQMTER